LVYPLPSGGPDAPTANVAKTSWYFSMDDLMLKEGTKKLGILCIRGLELWVIQSQLGLVSYKAVLDKGYDRFYYSFYTEALTA
jgi:hypothetical protein